MSHEHLLRALRNKKYSACHHRDNDDENEENRKNRRHGELEHWQEDYSNTATVTAMVVLLLVILKHFQRRQGIIYIVQGLVYDVYVYDEYKYILRIKLNHCLPSWQYLTQPAKIQSTLAPRTQHPHPASGAEQRQHYW